MTESDRMKEYQVIKYIAKYLRQKGYDILNITVRTHNEGEEIRKELNLDSGIFKKGEADVIAKAKWGRRILIEAKGSKYKYGIYTALGQMVCTLDDKKYTWFGLAFPQEWRKRLEKCIEKSSVLKRTNDWAHSKDKRLYFYFVDENGHVTPKTWSELLKS